MDKVRLVGLINAATVLRGKLSEDLRSDRVALRGEFPIDKLQVGRRVQVFTVVQCDASEPRGKHPLGQRKVYEMIFTDEWKALL